jgi:exodeoxyribonuclease VII large subunit
VGHETDTTLIDYVSDRRAPTPTAAAEIAVPVRSELLAYTEDLDRRVRRGLLRSIKDKRERLGGLARGLRDPQSMLQDKTQHLDHLDSRLRSNMMNLVGLRRQQFSNLSGQLRPELLKRGITQNLERLQNFEGRMGRSVTVIKTRAEDRLAASHRLLESLSYNRVLSRGYAIVKDANGKVISSTKSVKEGASAHIEFSDGARNAVFTDTPPAKEKQIKSKKPKAAEPDQGSLL